MHRLHEVTDMPTLATTNWSLSAISTALDPTIDRFRTLATARFDWLCVMNRLPSKSISADVFAARLVREICRAAGEPTLIDDMRVGLAADGMLDAIQKHDSAAVFGWLMLAVSYQGVSDAIVESYLDLHGNVTHAEIGNGLATNDLCRKLTSYWHFQACGYQKSTASCSLPEQLPTCPLPRHTLRNGRLNQTAYSLYLFIRDAAGGDIVSWLDRRLAEADQEQTVDRPGCLAASVAEPMSHVHGVSHKVISMSLSTLLLAGDPQRERWRAAGAAMIAVDTLVHNWLHRTGILRRYRAQHLYGPRCYAEGGCANIIRQLSRRIDARAFNSDFPRDFPRFVQHSIWSFCSQTGLNECNGNRIKDRKRCHRADCILYRNCGRVVLHKSNARVSQTK